MNEKIDLTKILKDCPMGWKFYSSVYGEVEFNTITLQRLTCRFEIDPPRGHLSDYVEDPYPIKFYAQNTAYCVSSAGEQIKGKGECTFFPSSEQRDWSKFTAPWYKKDKFDPKTLQPFDKVLACFTDQSIWCCGLFSCFDENANLFRCCGDAYYKYCIPYNDETKHLVGTKDEAPEHSRKWEN